MQERRPVVLAHRSGVLQHRAIPAGGAVTAPRDRPYFVAMFSAAEAPDAVILLLGHSKKV
jgi:hypothetical protein